MIRVDSLTVTYDNFTALDRVSLDVGSSEIVAVLGPSGSGKSTLLRAIAGLQPVASGTVSLDGENITATPIHERRVGLMFQDYALFPHHDVAGNVGFGLRMTDIDPATIESRVAEVLAWVDLAGFEQRPIASLSGGEQQRVALARALAPKPSVLMLDEPVGALDRSLRARLVPELSALLRSVRIAAIYVTHDQEEAFAIADRVAVLNGGRVVQIGTPEDLWHNPSTEFVARFFGFDNIADIRAANGIATTPWGAIPTDLADGAHRAVLPPGGAAIDPDGDIVGKVMDTEFVGGSTRVTVHCFQAMLTVDTHGLAPTIGEQVRIRVEANALVAVEPASDHD